MATASKFTKVSVVLQMSIAEAEAVLKFFEGTCMDHLNTDQQSRATDVYQSIDLAIKGPANVRRN